MTLQMWRMDVEVPASYFSKFLTTFKQIDFETIERSHFFSSIQWKKDEIIKIKVNEKAK